MSRTTLICQINVHTRPFSSSKDCLLGSFKVKRQTLREINLYARLFGTLEYLRTSKDCIFVRFLDFYFPLLSISVSLPVARAPSRLSTGARVRQRSRTSKDPRTKTRPRHLSKPCPDPQPLSSWGGATNLRLRYYFVGSRHIPLVQAPMNDHL